MTTRSLPAAIIGEMRERVAKATGPDRELDIAVCAAVVPGWRVWSGCQVCPADEADYYEEPEPGAADNADLVARGTPLRRADHPAGEWAPGPNKRTVFKNPNRQMAPPVTASIDAALALVERVLPTARLILEREPNSYARAEIIEGRNKRTRLLGDAENVDGEAPLAILSALLSALEQTR